MKRGKKIIYIASAISGTIALFLLIMLLLLPQIINKRDIKEKVVTVLSQKISGDVNFQTIDISFFPLPHLRIDHLIIHFDDGNKLSVASLKIYPSLLSLLSGDFRISRIYADAPKISLVYIQKQESSTEEEPEIKEIKILDTLSSVSPVFTVSINNGLLNILKDKKNIFTIENIFSEISMHDNMLEIDLDASTAFSKSISVKTELQRSQSSLEKIVFDIDSEDIDIQRAREVIMLFMAETLVDTIFSYIQEGDISSFSFHSEGSSIEDLGKMENMLISITSKEASLCGISMSTKVDIAHDTVLLDISLADKQRELKPTIACLTDQRSAITGTFDFEGLLKAESKPNTLLQTLKGNMLLNAKSGRIYKAATLVKIFSMLNVSGILKGSITDLTREGFGYNSIVINADIQDGNIIVKEAVMDAPSMKMVGTGKIDLIKKKVNMKILASSLKSVDSIVSKIPIIKDITGDSLLAVPISITGDLKNPTVNYLPLSSVETGILSIMENTIKLPVKVFQPSSHKKD